MATTKVNEEKLLNEMFVLLEYSDTMYDFVESLSAPAYAELAKQIRLRDLKESNARKL